MIQHQVPVLLYCHETLSLGVMQRTQLKAFEKLFGTSAPTGDEITWQVNHTFYSSRCY